MKVLNGAGGKFLNGNKRMYVNSEMYLWFDRVDSEWFNIIVLRGEIVISPWLFDLYMDEMKELRGRGGRRGCLIEGGNECMMLCSLADDLVLSGKSNVCLRLEAFGKLC